MPPEAEIHPGRIVRFECLESLNVTITAGAKALGVSRQTLNNIVNERTSISAEVAIRLERAFGSTAEMWLALQTRFDLAQARQHQRSLKI